MKKYIILLLALTSCSGFLKETDRDKFVPTEADHYASLMLGTFNDVPGVNFYVQYMSDEVAETDYTIRYSATREYNKPRYTWQKNIEMLEDGTRSGMLNHWQILYKQIAIANYVIEQIDDAAGTTQQKEFIKGEAHFIRSWCYFTLANLYAVPWESAEQAHTAYGVPLRTGTGVEPSYDKAMLDQCYALVLDDLGLARALIASSGLTKSKFHPTVGACDLLLSRVKLYMNDYQGAIEAATAAIGASRLMTLSGGSETMSVLTANSPEVLYSFSRQAAGLTQLNMEQAALVVNAQLMDSYLNGDMRKTVWFTRSVDAFSGDVSFYPRKWSSDFSAIGKANLRAAEAWLNRAEAYAATQQWDKARADITELLSKRYVGGSTITLPASNNDLPAFIMQERFKELCFEEHHRWFDLRRMGAENRAEIEHRYTLVDQRDNVLGTELYILMKNDPNYTLAVPMAEKENNPLIRDYERFDKLPEYI